MSMGPVIDDARVLLGWIKGRESFSRRDAYRSNSYRWPHAADIEPALALLEDHDYIRQAPQKPNAGRGRPRGVRYLVNPSVNAPDAP
jgi:hypothetical protein